MPRRRSATRRVPDDDDLTAHLRALYRSMYAVIRRIPLGHVATYGQVAELAGLPGGARVAASSLKVSSPTDQLPWQRVVGKASKTRARIAIHDPVGAAIQRNLLEEEGVTLGETGLIDLGVYGWLPSDTPRPQRREAITGRSTRAASPRRPPRSGSKRRASSSRR